MPTRNYSEIILLMAAITLFSKIVNGSEDQRRYDREFNDIVNNYE